ncbi:unnamed protein product, partial [Allacma fusca]
MPFPDTGDCSSSTESSSSFSASPLSSEAWIQEPTELIQPHSRRVEKSSDGKNIFVPLFWILINSLSSKAYPQNPQRASKGINNGNEPQDIYPESTEGTLPPKNPDPLSHYPQDDPLNFNEPSRHLSLRNQANTPSGPYLNNQRRNPAGLLEPDQKPKTYRSFSSSSHATRYHNQFQNPNRFHKNQFHPEPGEHHRNFRLWNRHQPGKAAEALLERRLGPGQKLSDKEMELDRKTRQKRKGRATLGNIEPQSFIINNEHKSAKTQIKSGLTSINILGTTSTQSIVRMLE